MSSTSSINKAIKNAVQSIADAERVLSSHKRNYNTVSKRELLASLKTLYNIQKLELDPRTVSRMEPHGDSPFLLDMIITYSRVGADRTYRAKTTLMVGDAALYGARSVSFFRSLLYVDPSKAPSGYMAAETRVLDAYVLINTHYTDIMSAEQMARELQHYNKLLVELDRARGIEEDRTGYESCKANKRGWYLDKIKAGKGWPDDHKWLKRMVDGDD